MANFASFLILMLFLWGRSLRFRNLRLHIRVMLLAMLLDYALVFALVLYRNALGKVEMGMHWTLKIHVPIAVITLGLYALTSWTGYQLWQGRPVRERLRFFDRLLVPARVLTFLTSVMVEFLR